MSRLCKVCAQVNQKFWRYPKKNGSSPDFSLACLHDRHGLVVAKEGSGDSTELQPVKRPKVAAMIVCDDFHFVA
jgi:hypothetical protein